MDQDTDQLHTEIEGLRAELARLNAHRYIRVHNSLHRLVAFQFLRGLAFGLGSVLGATILVSVVAYFLSHINFLPIIGDWANEIARQIDADRATTYGVPEDTPQ